MIDKLFALFILLLGVFVVFIACSSACAYKKYATGHRYIKAFRAQSSYQRAFTLLHRTSVVAQEDLYKITNIGYIVLLICSITSLLVIPFCIVMYFINFNISMWTFLYWCISCFVLGVIAEVVQLLDSWWNAILESLGK